MTQTPEAPLLTVRAVSRAYGPRAAVAEASLALHAGEITALLGASGYPLASAAVQSTTPPAQILNLFLTAGDASGTLDLTFDPDALAKTYEVQITTTHPIDGPWTTMVQPTTSYTKLTGLTSGQRVWLRVRGIGSNGPGAWSDPATKIVP